MKHRGKGLRAAVIFILVCIGMLSCGVVVSAAPSNTRGRIAIDLADFKEKGHSGGSGHGLETDKYGYKLFFKNHFFYDRSNNGVTYRSNKTYDMTDVERIEFFAFTQTTIPDKFMIYSTTREDQTYHAWDYDNVNNSMYSGTPTINGKVYNFTGLTDEITQFLSRDDFMVKRFDVTMSYEQRYMYIGISHAWRKSTATIHLGNGTYNQSETDGSIALLLKEHKVTLLAPEKKLTRIGEDNVEEEYEAYSDIAIKMENGKTYMPGQTASIYRDERIVFSCEYTEPTSAKLAGFKIYADKDRKTLLYTIKPSGFASQVSNIIQFDSSLIQKIENAAGKTLGDFYLEPIFERVGAYYKTADNAANLPKDSDRFVSLIMRKTSNGYACDVYDDGIDVMGTIDINNANYVGDYMIMNYEANPDYKGMYGVSKVYIRSADTEAQIPTTVNQAYFYPKEGIDDYNEKITNRFVWLQVYLLGRVDLKLEDKTVTFNNKEVKIDPAKASYDIAIGEKPKHLDDIEYTYYEDEECTKKLSGAPVNAGTYYVIATMKGDEDYLDATSNKAKIVIEKAVPKIQKAIGTTIKYGQPLSDSVFTDVNATAVGVTGQKIPGTFTWAEENADQMYLNAGIQKAKIRFTIDPDSVYAKNYKDYVDSGTQKSGRVTVQAVNVRVEYTDGTFTYDGNVKAMETAKVYVDEPASSINGNQMLDAPVKYTYYSDAQCKNKLSEAPVNVGEYWAKASVSSGGNYNPKTSDPAKITITPAAASLLQVPLQEQYRVYLQGITGEIPNGTIHLQVTSGGTTITELDSGEFLKDAKGRLYAAFDYAAVTNGVAEGASYTVKVSYKPDVSKVQNYTITDNTLAFENGVRALIKEVTLQYGDSAQYSKACKWNEDFFGENAYGEDANLTISWPFQNLSSDVVTVTPDNATTLDGGFQFTAKNAGHAYVLGFVKETFLDGTTTANYLLYSITVEPAQTVVSLQDKEVTFDGKEQSIDPANVMGRNADGSELDLTEVSAIAYHYYSDVAMTQELEELPIEAGTYYVKAAVPAQTNHTAGESTAVTLTIRPATPTITMESKIVTYDGEVQIVEAVVEGIASDTQTRGSGTNAEWPVTGTISYTYKEIGGGFVDKPVNAGIYNMTATVAGDGNYAEVSTTALLSIEKASAVMEAEDQTVVYNGQPVPLDVTFKVQNAEKEIPASVKYQYIRQGDRVDDITSEPPVNAGTYFAIAIMEDDPNYLSDRSNLAKIVIQKAQPVVTITEQTSKEYDGNPVAVDSALVTVDGADMTAQLGVSYTYYEGVVKKRAIEPPTNAGAYWVKAMVAEQENYKAAESDYHVVVIQKKQPVVVIPEQIEKAYDGGPVSVKTAVVMVNGEDKSDQFEVRYKYYSDSAATQEISAPTEIGTYYVKAFSVEQTNYKPGESDAQTIIIKQQEDPDENNPDGEDPDGGDPDGGNPDGSNPDGSNSDGSNTPGGGDNSGGGNGSGSDGSSGGKRSPSTGDTNRAIGYLIAIGIAAAVVETGRRRKNEK